jgi:hypothetical protein
MIVLCNCNCVFLHVLTWRYVICAHIMNPSSGLNTLQLRCFLHVVHQRFATDAQTCHGRFHGHVTANADHMNAMYLALAFQCTGNDGATKRCCEQAHCAHNTHMDFT